MFDENSFDDADFGRVVADQIDENVGESRVVLQEEKGAALVRVLHLLRLIVQTLKLGIGGGDKALQRTVAKEDWG